ncbi:hypothetical protein SS50377_22581 [Spironucleus salmonicida]|uniref:Uncharacterized protein n=1 Tax=Spironucleus salmonicida TaxID=348837 RepID=V6LBV1_9EUKA|nr:hypothetical protein SS50377_22581 [Spironucleus salmonicida]|eukprot:EST41927.1 Hypothetical protein SS50377_18231 [Spironucleus salmonicida]
MNVCQCRQSCMLTWCASSCNQRPETLNSYRFHQILKFLYSQDFPSLLLGPTWLSVFNYNKVKVRHGFTWIKNLASGVVFLWIALRCKIG